MSHTGAVRIALVHYTSLPVIAGVELVMSAQAGMLAGAGHEVTVVSGNGGFPELLAESESAQRARAAAERGGEGDPAFRLAVEMVKPALRATLGEQDVVLLHNVMTMHFHLALTVALWELAEELRTVRFIGWVHDLAACNPDYAPLPFGREPWALLARAHPRCEYVAVSEHRRRQFVELTGMSARVIPNGVQPMQMLDLPATIAMFEEIWGLLDRDVVLIHPTRLLRRKNVELTLRVAAAIKATGRSCACLITAPPDLQNPASDYEMELQELQRRLGLRDDVFFLNDHGLLSADEMRGVFALADALFFPSRQEGFGIPLLEAALHRLPIFCSNIEPLNSILGHDVTTFSLDARPEDIASLMVQTLDSNPAHRMRKLTLRSYSWDAIYRNFLAPLLAGPKASDAP